MLYERHKEKLKFRIGVLIDNPTEKRQEVQLFGMDYRQHRHNDVKIMDFFSNHLFDDGELTMLNNYIMSRPLRIIMTVIKSDNTSQVFETIYLSHYSPNGCVQTLPVMPQQDPNQHNINYTNILYQYVLDCRTNIRINILAFTSMLIEFVPTDTDKKKSEYDLNKYPSFLNQDSEIGDRKKKYLFIM